MTTLPDGITEVDVIIHECMGYFLFYEHMIDTVLYARDKWLRKDGKGVILPDKIQMFICAIEDEQYRKEKINCKKEKQYQQPNSHPLLSKIDMEQKINIEHVRCTTSHEMTLFLLLICCFFLWSDICPLFAPLFLFVAPVYSDFIRLHRLE